MTLGIRLVFWSLLLLSLSLTLLALPVLRLLIAVVQPRRSRIALFLWPLLGLLLSQLLISPLLGSAYRLAWLALPERLPCLVVSVEDQCWRFR